MKPFDLTGSSSITGANVCAAGQAAQTPKSTEVFTDTAHALYPVLFRPEAYRGQGTPYYSLCIGVFKDDHATLDRISAAIRLAIAREVVDGKLYGLPLPNGVLTDETIQSFVTTVHVGELEHPGDKRFEPYVLVNSKSYTRPAVVDVNGQQITDPDAVQHGMMCRAKISFSTYHVRGKYGVSCTLHGVQILD